MTAFSHAVLRVAALLLSVAVLPLAPLFAALAETARAAATGRGAPPPLAAWRHLRGLALAEPLAAPGEAAAGGALLGAFAFTALAALLIPGPLTGTPLTRMGDLPEVAAFLVLARLLQLGALLAAGRSAAIPRALGVPVAAASLLPALLPAAVAGAALGAVRLDALPGALAAADPATAALLFFSVALAAFADAETGAGLADGLAGPARALAEATAALRLLALADLVGLFLPALPIADALAGPLAWAGSIGLYALRTLLLAVLLGLARAAVGRLPAPTREAVLGAATLLGLLGATFVFIGESFA